MKYPIKKRKRKKKEQSPACLYPPQGGSYRRTLNGHRVFKDTHLVDEGCELAVETLDLLLLLMLHTLSIGVDLQVQGCEQALIDRDGGDAGWAGPADASRAVPAAASTGARAEGPTDTLAAEAP